jgi:hypothetical protein
LSLIASMTSSKDASAAGGRARINLVFILLVASVGIAAKGIRDRLWPWGLAESLSWENRPQYSLIDFENDSLRAERKLHVHVNVLHANVNVLHE